MLTRTLNQALENFSRFTVGFCHQFALTALNIQEAMLGRYLFYKNSHQDSVLLIQNLNGHH